MADSKHPPRGWRRRWGFNSLYPLIPWCVCVTPRTFTAWPDLGRGAWVQWASCWRWGDWECNVYRPTRRAAWWAGLRGILVARLFARYRRNGMGDFPRWYRWLENW